MSFGVGVGDVLTITGLTYKLYSAFKTAPGEFRDIGELLETFHNVLLDLKTAADNPHSLVNTSGQLPQVRSL